MSVAAQDGFKNVTIEPGTTKIFHFKINSQERILPGTYKLTFNATFSWQENEIHTGNLIVSQDIDLSVFGESAILAAFKLPAFLLLPGFIVLLTIQLLWKLKYKTMPEYSILKYDMPEFWLISITLSIIIAILYPILSGHSYLSSYGTTDIIITWVSSIFLGGVLFCAIFWIPDAIRQKRIYIYLEDPIIQVLEKMKNQGLTHYRPRFEESEVIFFLYGKGAKDKGNYFVGPAIKGTLENITDVVLSTKIRNCLDKNDRDSFSELINSFKNNPGIELCWSHENSVKYLEKPEEYQKYVNNKVENIFITE